MVEEFSVLDKDGNVIETKNVLYINESEISEKRIDVHKNTFHTTTKNVCILYIINQHKLKKQI